MKKRRAPKLIIDDAAHELRTYQTTLQELSQFISPGERPTKVREQVETLSRLVDELKALADHCQEPRTESERRLMRRWSHFFG